MSSLEAKKWKSCKIYGMIYDEYGEACFWKEKDNKWAKHGFFTTNLIEK